MVVDDARGEFPGPGRQASAALEQGIIEQSRQVFIDPIEELGLKGRDFTLVRAKITLEACFLLVDRADQAARMISRAIALNYTRLLCPVEPAT